MNAENFVYWLQGYLELREDDKPLTPKQTQVIKDHLALVFTKVTPDRKAEPSKDEEPDVWPSPGFDPFNRPDVYCAPATVTPAVIPEKLNVDEIVKKIEAGNISLSLPGTRFVTVFWDEYGLVEYWSGRSGLNLGRPGTGRIC